MTRHNRSDRLAVALESLESCGMDRREICRLLAVGQNSRVLCGSKTPTEQFTRHVELLAKHARKPSIYAELCVRFREHHGITQVEAAARFHVTCRTWRNWESGRTSPRAHHAWLLKLEPHQCPACEQWRDYKIIAKAADPVPAVDYETRDHSDCRLLGAWGC